MQTQTQVVKNGVKTTQKEDKVVAEVRETMNFDQFNSILGNRGISDRHVAALIKSIGKKNLLKQNPIIVTHKREIIDGQHRLQAARALMFPIYYILSDDDAGLNEVQQLNTYNKTWTVNDYLVSYIVKGKTQYAEFKEFLDEYELSVEGGFILAFGRNDKDLYYKFREGDFKWTTEEMATAKNVADVLTDIRKYMVDGNYRRVYLLKALTKIYKDGLSKQLIEKLRHSQQKLTVQFSLRDYLRMFEDVLNWNRKVDPLRLY